MKRKLFFTTVAVFVVLISFVIGMGFGQTTHATPPLPTEPDAYSLWQLTNQDRATAGLQPLVLDAKLSAAAQDKCSDMAVKNYWSHDTPYGKKWTAFIQAHESYTNAGENESYGWPTSQAVESGWMGSPGHKANILQPLFTNVGYAVCQAHNYTSPHLSQTDGFIVTQEFTQE